MGFARHLKRRTEGERPWGAIQVDKAIPWVEGKTGLSLSDSQRQAIRLVVQSKMAIITGGPGAGKTTLVNSLLQILTAKRVQVQLCAPTGRAAKRLSESTALKPKPSTGCWRLTPRCSPSNATRKNPLISISW